MAQQMLVCPTCSGDGSGDASMKGPTTAAGMCRDCLAEGQVTVEKWERLTRATYQYRMSATREPSGRRLRPSSMVLDILLAVITCVTAGWLLVLTSPES